VIYGGSRRSGFEEQAEALQGLAATHSYVDLTRVGVSLDGAGSMTLNLMFRYPDLYTGSGRCSCGRPDAYDSILPGTVHGPSRANAKGYHDGSPISFASGLKGKLLIIHARATTMSIFRGPKRLLNADRG